MAADFLLILDTAGRSDVYMILGEGPENLVVAANGANRVALASANWQQAVVRMSDSGHAKHYTAAKPAGLTAGSFWWAAHAGAAGAEAITDELLGGPASYVFDGTQEVLVGATAAQAAAAILVTPANKLDTDENGKVTAVFVPESVDFVVTPLDATQAGNAPATILNRTIHRHSSPVESWAVAYDVSAVDLRLVAALSATPIETGQFQYESGGSGITVTGTDGKTVNVAFQDTDIDSISGSQFWYYLWDMSAKRVLVEGAYAIRPSVRDLPAA